jgi:hypothetical protein
VADDGAGEAPLVGWGADHGQVAQAFGQAAGGGVGADQLELDVRVAVGPAALELQGVAAHGRPGVAEGSAAAAVLSALLYVPVGIVTLASHPPTPRALGYAAAAGILPSAVPFLADLLALRRVPAASSGSS